MSNRFKIIGLILLGIALSLTAGFGTFVYTRAIETELTAARASLKVLGETVKVPVPKADVQRGDALQANDFIYISLPSSPIPGNVLRDLPAATPEAPFVALSDMAQGEMVLTGALARSGDNPDFGLMVSAGGRAFAVAPRNLEDFKDLLVVGGSVDLVWTRGIGAGRTETRLVGSALRILALGQAPEGGPPSPLDGKIVLEGSGAEPFLVPQAEQTGYFHILLSDGNRRTNAGEISVGLEELEDLPLVVRRDANAPAGPEEDPGVISRITGASERRATCTTAVVRGGGRTTVEVPC